MVLKEEDGDAGFHIFISREINIFCLLTRLEAAKDMFGLDKLFGRKCEISLVTRTYH